MRLTVPVRLARPADAVAIATMSRDLIERGLPWRWTAPRIRASLRDRDTNVAVAMDEGVLLGFGIMQYADEEAHLLLFAVAERHRRQGVGTALLDWLEAVAREAGIRRIQLECRRENEAARNFYGSLAYHERHIVRRMYSGVEDGIKLEKWLSR
jgi:[ribosomal protein S18]-alanine N-acetyltransferase